jgi:hypothetical protein
VEHKEPITCGFCEKEIKKTKGKTIFYSNYLTEYFCDLNCLDSRYSDYMGTMHIQITK